MIKERYQIPDDGSEVGVKIATARGLLHGINWPLFIYLGQPLTAFCYLVSFCYHRIDFREDIFRFLDHMVITLRIIAFPTIGERIGWLIFVLLFPFIWLLFAYCLGSNIQWPNLFMYLEQKKFYKHLQILMGVIFAYRVATEEYTDVKVSGLAYVFSIMIYFLKPKMSWHNEHWESHDDFHLITLIIDFILISHFDVYV